MRNARFYWRFAFLLHILLNYTLTNLCDEPHKIVNDEGKINGLEGNRMVDGDIIAGNIIIANDDGRGGTVNLTDKQIAEYSKRFSSFEAYTQDEVQGSAYMYFMEF